MDRLASQFLRLCALLLLFVVTPTWATIDAPDHVYYGSATLYGTPVPAGTVVEARSKPDGVLLRRYTVGSNSHLGNYYKLAIPLDTVDPRKPGRARVGDPIRIFVGGQLAAEVSVGIDPVLGVRGIGSTTRLDLDPQNMGTGPAISIADASVVEGNSGQVDATLTVTLNTTAGRDVGVRWETQDGTATGGAVCGAGVDFIRKSNQTLTILAGSLQASLTVAVCGDAVVEGDETFKVALLSTVDDFGVLSTASIATVTIVDDDDVPTLSVGSVRVAEPASGTATARFIATLSRSHDHPVSFDWATQNGTASAGSDYVAANGTVNIPTGETQASFDVTVLADAIVEPDETFRVVFSHPVNVNLVQTQAWATIVDLAHDPAVEETDAVTGQDVPDLAKPSAIVLSSDGLHAYAASSSRNAVLHFDRDPVTGTLGNAVSYKATSTGFSAALLKNPQDLKLSPDGSFLYLAAMDDNAITVLARNATDGSLGFVQSLVHGGTVVGMKKPVRLAISPDGAQVYVLARESNALTRFGRDAATGQLSFAGSLDQSAPGLGKLVSPQGIAISPDGAHVYVTARMGNALIGFDRNGNSTSPDYGKLSVRQTLASGLNGFGVGLNGAYGIAISSDGRQVYVAAETDNAVAWFDRAADGQLGLRSVLKRGDAGVFGLGGAQGVEVVPNGKEVFVTGAADDSLSIFRRNIGNGPQAGGLSIRRTLFKGDNGLQHLFVPGAMASSLDDQFLYVAASGGDSAIVVYRRLGGSELFSDGFEDLVN